MNKRREQIISHLLNQRLMTVKDLALEFGAGERTIRNDFRELNSYLETSELGPVEVEKGRLVSAEDFDQVRLLQDTEDLYPYKLTQSERTGLAGILLGVEDGYVALAQLADRDGPAAGAPVIMPMVQLGSQAGNG